MTNRTWIILAQVGLAIAIIVLLLATLMPAIIRR
jgi:hypothetical protein